MEPFIGMAGLGAAGLATFGAFGLAFRQRRRRLAAASETSPAAVAAASRAAAKAAPRSTAERLEALAARQAELGQRLDALAGEVGAPEERLQAMAGQLLGLIRDKNATLETALAGLDQLRARLRALEQMGEPAEARALLDGLVERLGAVETAQGADRAATEARLAALAEVFGGTDTAADFARVVADLGERLTRLQESRDARTEKALDTALARIAPLETRLAAVEGTRAEARSEGREGLKRLEARIETLHGEGAALGSALAAAKAEALAAAQAAAAPVRALAEEVARLHDRKDEGIEAVITRLGAIERELAARDPEALVDARVDARIEGRIEGRLGALDARLAAFGERLARAEDRGADQGPLAALAERLAALQADRDAATGAMAEAMAETMIARLGPVESRLAAYEAALAAADPQGALDRFAERLEGVAARTTALEGAGRSSAAVSEQLADLYRQKDAALEALVGRLAPMEARLAELDPQGALDRFGERLEAVQARVSLIEGAENPVAEIAERLAELHARKDLAVEALMQRLAPMEAKLAELDPQGALDRFGERLEAVQARVSLVEGAGNPVAEITERLAELHTQKDIAVEALMQRLAPMEARLAELDPQGALDRFGERLEAVQARVSLVEGAGNPVAEITERLAELHAQKDGAVAALVERLAPLEARLAAVEGGVARVLPLAEEDPRTALAALKARLEGLDHAQEAVAVGLETLRAGLARTAEAEAAAEGRAEGLATGLATGQAAGTAAALAEVVDGMTRLFAQKDAGLAALLARLAPLEERLNPLEERLNPLEERLAAVEARPRDPAVEEAVDEAAGAAAEAEAARAEARAVAERLALVQAAAEASAERAALFADRISELEASLPRLSAAEAQTMAGTVAGTVAGTMAGTMAGTVGVGGDTPAPAPAAPLLEALRDLPRVVSLHQK